MRAIFEISTGKLIEAADYVTEGSLTATAIENGYAADNLEEREITQEELQDLLAPSADKEARNMRNELLSACDWAVLPDSPLSEAQIAAWKTYRQALRDVPGQADFPTTIVWPTQPE